MGPWQSCPLPGPGAAGETSFWPPSLSSCEERGEPLPILVAVAGLLSPPVSYLIPILALKPRIPALYSQGAQDSKYGLGTRLLLSSVSSSALTTSPHKDLAVSFLLSLTSTSSGSYGPPPPRNPDVSPGAPD